MQELWNYADNDSKHNKWNYQWQLAIKYSATLLWQVRLIDWLIDWLIE